MTSSYTLCLKFEMRQKATIKLTCTKTIALLSALKITRDVARVEGRPAPDDTIWIVSVITFYLPSCIGQETAKGPFGLQVYYDMKH